MWAPDGLLSCDSLEILLIVIIGDYVP
uniref:Uncharacterized protein n=1 Tax=Anguilla anguilla TaxID=7936 RepID=A0A0E9ULJ9_ANGAN